MNDKISIKTYLITFFLSLTLCTSYTFMLVSTYDFKVSFLPVFFSFIIAGAFFTFVHTRERKRWSYITLITVPVIVVLLIYLNAMDLNDGIMTLLSLLKAYSFKNLPMYFYESQAGLDSFTIMFSLIGMIPLSFTTYTIARRKSPFISLIFLLPYFLISVALVYMFPGFGWSIMVFCSTIVLILLQGMKKADRDASEKTILMLIIPVFLITLFVGTLFSPKNYKQDEIAIDCIRSVRSSINGKKNKTFFKTLNTILDYAEEGEPHSINQKIVSVVGMDTGRKDLRNVGNFNPPKAITLQVAREKNPLYEGNIISTPYLYIRSESLDEYDGMSWDESTALTTYKEISHDTGDNDSLYPYKLSIIPVVESDDDTFPIPYYTANYYGRGTPIGNIDIDRSPDDPFFSYYYYSNTPLKMEDDYSFIYDEYVTSSCLYVPDEVKSAIIDTGVLPDWYMELYNGEKELSDADKVRMVTSFVSGLHPYDEDTDYPPDDVEFVSWFIKDSETGFCVHYATTTVVLLRMIGVPARYVNGYLVSGMTNDKKTSVYSTDAHAWFEFYTSDYGWIMGDSTPGNGTASSYYDVNALGKVDPAYASELEEVQNGNNTNYSIPEPTDVPEPDVSVVNNTPNPSIITTINTPQVETEKVQQEKTTKISTPVIVIFVVAMVILSLVILRIAFIIYWRSKFTKGDNNQRARSYYHYFSLISKIFKSTPSKGATRLAEQAAFSGNILTDKELSELIHSGENKIKASIRNLNWYQLLIYRALKVRSA